MSSVRRTLFVFALTTLLLGATSTAPANALANPAIEPLEQAEAAYQAGDYEQVIVLAQKELSQKEISPLTQVAAYRLLALSYTAQGNAAGAHEAADNLIRLYPSYAPSSADPAEFGSLIDESKQRYADGELVRKKKKGRVPQFVYNTIAVVVSAAVLYVGYESTQ